MTNSGALFLFVYNLVAIVEVKTCNKYSNVRCQFVISCRAIDLFS